MLYFAVTGDPIGHSKSPELFRGAYPGRERDFAYFRLVAKSVEEARRLFQELPLDGMNITAPFKAAENWKVDYRDQVVNELEAGNTLVREQGRILFYNTDVCGVSGALKAAGVSVEGKRCLVVGAGGAGKAAVYALSAMGGVVIILNRTVEKAIRLARQYGCESGSLACLSSEFRHADIIVNTWGVARELLPVEVLHEGQVFLDAVYTDVVFRERVERKGCLYIDGHQWLLWQGVPAYRSFTGEEPNRACMEMALNKSHVSRSIAFIGFMGVGKSTVASLLADRLELPCWDVDRELECRYKETIPEMIQFRGEACFREREYEMTRELLLRAQPGILSCGGGVVENPELRKLLREYSRVVWLYAAPEVCVSRIALNSRPLLARAIDPLVTARQLFAMRKSFYAECASILVATDRRCAEEVCQVLYEEISK